MDPNKDRTRQLACFKATKRALVGQLEQFGPAHSIRAVNWYLASFAAAHDDKNAALETIISVLREEFELVCEVRAELQQHEVEASAQELEEKVRLEEDFKLP